MMGREIFHFNTEQIALTLVTECQLNMRGWLGLIECMTDAGSRQMLVHICLQALVLKPWQPFKPHASLIYDRVIGRVKTLGAR